MQFAILVGVLMLNAVLTVRAGNANSHKDRGWEQLTDAVIQYLNKNSSNLVFMLWGSYAQKKGSHINQVCVPQCLHVHSAPNDMLMVVLSPNQKAARIWWGNRHAYKADKPRRGCS